MRIAQIEMALVRIPLITPFKTALRSVDSVEDVILRLTLEDGTVGYGEAPPTKAITGETIETIQAVLRTQIVPALRSLPSDADVPARLQAVRDCCKGNTSAKAAMDIALHDAAARQAGLPLYRYLMQMAGETTRTGSADASQEPKLLYTDLTISVNPIPVMAADAQTAVARGFRSLKIKVGKEGEQDLERIAAIRDAVGEEISILVDANQGWTADEAVHILRRAQELGLKLQLVEQPVKAEDLEGLARVTASTDYPVVADESSFHPEDAQRIFDLHAADMVNIKLMKCGGLLEARRIADIARRAGAHCMMGSMLESRISTSAAAHFAASQGNLMAAVDLDGPMLCAENPYLGGPVYDGPVIRINETPGLGITGIAASYLGSWETL